MKPLRVQHIIIAGAVVLLVGASVGLVPVRPALAQTPTMPVFMPMASAPVIVTSGFNLQLTSAGLMSTPGAPIQRTYDQVPGRYCTDSSGGQTYVPAGAPVPDGLTCSSQSGGS